MSQKTECDFCGRTKAINDKFETRNGVDVCEICQQIIERYTEESDELELEKKRHLECDECNS